MDLRLENVSEPAARATEMETSLNSTPGRTTTISDDLSSTDDVWNRRWLKAELLSRCAQHYNFNADALSLRRGTRGWFNEWLLFTMDSVLFQQLRSRRFKEKK